MLLRSPLFCNEVPRHLVRGPDVSKHRTGLIFTSRISVNGYFEFWMLEHYIVSSRGAPVTQRSDPTSKKNLLIWLLKYSMEQSPWEANRSSASQEIRPQIMKREGSLPQSQVPATCPHPETDRPPSKFPHPTSWRSILILSSHIRLGLPSGLVPSGFPTETLYTLLLSPISDKCPTHLINLDLITRTIPSEERRSLSQENGNLKVIYCSVLSVSWRTYALCK